MTSRRLLRSLGLVMGLAVLSRLTGFGRELAVAARFGATAASDAYLLAYSIPNLAAAVLGGALARALLPPVAAHLAVGRPAAAARLGWSVANAVALVTLAAVAAGIWWAGPLLRLLAPGLRREQAPEALAAVRILLPATFFYCTGMVLAALLQARRRFALPAGLPAAQNLLMGAGALLLGGAGVAGLAWVTLLAIALDFVVPLWGLRQARVPYEPALDRTDLARVGRLALPLALGALVNQAATAVDWAVASTTGPGAIAALNFADRLRQVPLGLFAATAATVLYPHLAELAAAGESAAFRAHLGRSLGLLLAVTAPAAVALAVLREPLVELLFAHGRFDHRASVMTATALLGYAPGLVGLAAGSLLATAFAARQETGVLLAVGAGGAALNAGLDLVLAPRAGHGGIAAAGSLAALATAAAYLWLLVRRTGALPGLGRTLARTAAACALLWAGASAALAWSPTPLAAVLAGGAMAGLALLGAALPDLRGALPRAGPAPPAAPLTRPPGP